MKKVYVLALVTLAAAVAVAATGANYLYLPSDDPDPVGTATILAIRQQTISYVDLATAGLTTFTTGYAYNVSVPSGPLGTYLVAAGSASLALEVGPVGIITGGYLGATLVSGLTFNTLDDVTKIYNYWPKPLGIVNWRTDDHFGRLRQTYFPLYITKTKASDISALPASFPALARVALNTYQALGTLYHENYASQLQKAGLSALPCKMKALSDIAFFRSELLTKKLIPLGIFISGEWVTPSDGAAWLLAKMVSNAIDSNLLPMSHFADTHLQDEPIEFAMERQMSKSHPVYNFIKPVTDMQYGLVALGFPSLFNIGTGYDILSAYGAIGMHTFINNDWASKKWSDRYIANDLAARGVTNLPGYQYGQDMLAWDGIFRNFATDFVKSFYATDNDVKNDPQLQAVFAEASDPNFGSLYGFPEVKTINALVDVVTHMLVSVVKHHATNLRAFSEAQLTLPYAPWIINCAWPGKASVTENFILNSCLTDLTSMASTINIAYNFNRTFTPYYSMKFTPQLRLAGTGLAVSRTKMAVEIALLDAVIQARTDTILPYQVLQSTKLPISHFA